MSSVELKELEYDEALAPREEATGLGALMALLENAERPLPLADVRVRTAIVGDCCQSTMRQRFVNGYDVPIEAVYIFPLPADGAVTKLVLRIGEREIRAECREREQAEKELAQARREGRRAGLLTEERSDVYTIRVTNLAPQTDVAVEIEWLERLVAVDGRFRWRLPTVIPPRYVPGEPTGFSGPGSVPDTDRVPDASRLQPPLRLAGGTALDLEVTLWGRPTYLASSQHAVRLNVETGEQPCVRIAPQASATLDRDFVLAYSLAEPEACVSRAWTDGQHTLAIVEPPAEANQEALPRDVVFVIDVSGSMQGPKIEAAKRALSAALHGLVAADRFTIYAFNHQLLPWVPGGAFQPYNDATLKHADSFVHRLQAEGGTEMLPAIGAALAGDTPTGRLRTILLITDAEVGNDDELVACVAGRAPNVRLFTLGIDTAVHAGLLQRLAAVGGGTCDLCTPDEDIEAAVASVEARFGSPVVDGITFEGATAASDGPRALFVGQPVSALLEGAPPSLTVRGQAYRGRFEQTMVPGPAPFPLGPLWARERIAALENAMIRKTEGRDKIRDEIRAIALRFGILSRYTAMVAVDHQKATDGSPVEVVQPVELPYGWDGSFRDWLAPAVPSAGRPFALMAPHAASYHTVACASFGTLVSAPGTLRSRTRQSLHRAPGGADDIAGELARRQAANGSFADDVLRTAAAVVCLVLLGHTRRRGLRQRTVQKSARWLAGHPHEPDAALALKLLEDAEHGGQPAELAKAYEKLIARLSNANDEGTYLRQVVADLTTSAGS